MSANRDHDVIIVGAGIVGLANAWMAARAGRKVKVLERSGVAEGATVRNFGMVWPIGQPAGELYQLALRSQSLWRELAEQGAVDAESCGSIHAAHHDDEMALLREFVDRGTHQAEILSAAEVLQRSCLIQPNGLRGGMWSATELRVDPRTAAARIAAWLQAHHDVEFEFGCSVTSTSGRRVTVADGRSWSSEQVIICSGSDLQTLYPQVFASSGLRLCKLQMLRVDIQPSQVGPAPHVASGLTLRHYRSFEGCPGLDVLKNRIAETTPELDRFGIHVMASPFPDGRVILGDSHEYDAQISPFDKAEIDELMLRELRKILRLDNWIVRERWSGIYSKLAEGPIFSKSVEPGVQVFVGPGGAGMTMSFGLAEKLWNASELTQLATSN